MPVESGGPRHVAIIMDGNGRWACARGYPRAHGHKAGAEATRAVVRAAPDLGIRTLTLFAFSSENWRRPGAEVSLLMALFKRTIRREIHELRARGVRLCFIGARERLSPALQADMRRAERLTEANDRLNLLIAVDFGGRWDLVRAARTLARACVDGEQAPDAIDEAVLGGATSLAEYGGPDLFIRTGGERRISNFLLWDLAYTELYFADTLWPDFDGAALAEAVHWFGGRERRFGAVDETRPC